MEAETVSLFKHKKHPSNGVKMRTVGSLMICFLSLMIAVSSIYTSRLVDSESFQMTPPDFVLGVGIKEAPFLFLKRRKSARSRQFITSFARTN